MMNPEQLALTRIRQAAESAAASLDLSRLGLTSLPPEIGELASLTKLNLASNQFTTLPPEIGKLANLQTLNLWGNRLTSLPPEIGALANLTELNVAGNQLTSLPPEIGELANLTTLYLGGNQLTTLPPEIGALANLQTLNLLGNQLTSLPPEIGTLASLTKLDLSKNHLTSLPPEIGALANLQTLNLWDNRLTSLPPEIGALANLTELNLEENRLTFLPPEIGKLANLTELHLSWNRLTSLPPEIGALASLTKLNLRFNQLTSLPPEIGELASLQTLILWDNQLTSLPPEIGKLASLTKLDLAVNQLTSLPPEIGALANLQTLNLWDNQLTSLPPEIGKLANLQTLNLWNNQLTSLPPEIGALANLTELDLAVNQLTTLPPEIGKLANLTTLSLWGNQLTSLPPEIGTLASLTELSLGVNQLTSLPPEIGQLANLQTLNLRNNRLTTLPPEIANLHNLKSLNLWDNPLTLALPRALLLSDDAQAIFRFYRAIWEGGKPLGEVRLLFVGQPGAGKTQLIRRLRGLDFQQVSPSTMTVETHTLPLGSLTAHLWDFGGQDFMHATHPFFFSARCVYVLVLNVRQTYEQNRVEYWLRTIRAFGGDSPVIVVGSHADAEQHVLDLPQNRLRGDFPSIAAFLQTSAKDARGLDDLRAALQRAADSLPHVRVLFAQSHLAVKEALEQAKQRLDIIPYPHYAGLCGEQGVTDEEDQRTLLALLHDLGVVLDFRDEQGEPLSPDGILNPNWVTEAVYRLITDPQLRGETRGRLTPALVRRILSGYQPHHRDLILKLMRRFELAYPSGEDWWLPNAMPQDEPAAAGGAEWSQALTFEYAYPELPESVITRFIVRTNEWMEKDLVWRWGVILASAGNRALVRARPDGKKVEIRVGGPEYTRRDLLALIRGHFEVIHRTFTEGKGKDGFEIQEFLCPPQYPGLWLSYRDLLIYEKDGLAQIPQTWQGRVIYLNVREVLNGFVTPEARREERERLFPEEERRMKEEEQKGVYISIGNMQGSNLVFGEGNQVTQTIQGSFNTPANPELAPLLAQLTAAVEEMAKHLPAEQAAETREDLTRLQEELAKPKPQKKWYSVSIEGLKAAAQNVGEIGAPVIELAAKLLQLLPS